MNIADFKRFLAGLAEGEIETAEPHVSRRCEENDIAIDDVKRALLSLGTEPCRFVQDRPGVYKVYYRLSKRRELKIIVRITPPKSIKILTVRVLDKRFRMGVISRRRF